MPNSVEPTIIATTYPVPVYRYVVEVGGVRMHFSEVSGLDIKYEPITYKDGLKIQHMPGQEAIKNITFKRGILRASSELYLWIKETNINLISKRLLEISLSDTTGDVPIITWLVADAFPTGLIGPTLNANANEVSIETLVMRAQSVVISTWDGA